MNRETTRTYPELKHAQIEPSAGSMSPVAEADVHEGGKLGRYVILYRVGGGGMGEVFAAYDPQLDRKVAVKLLRSEIASEKYRMLAQREAQAMAKLTHPNVVTVHDAGTYGHRAFIAMEYVDGKTLKEWLTLEEHPWQHTVEIFLQAGRGLAAAHAAGLLHQDFKPSNVMLTRDGGVRVLDFGLARVHHGDAKSAETQKMAGLDTDLPLSTDPLSVYSDALLGTPAYLAPERLEGRAGDARSDQFSFCVALYQALYREHPFAATDLEAYLDRVHRREIREPPATTQVPDWLRKALLRGLSPDPGDRFSAMDDLLGALSPEPKATRSRWLLAAAGLLALGGILMVSYRDGEQTPICSGAQSKLANIWDAQRKVRVEAAFHATESAFAGEAFRRVEQVLDEYAAGWVDMRTEACEATYVLGEQSETRLDQRMLCLDGRLEEVRALTDLFLEEADAQTVTRSVSAAEKLSGLSRCADPAQLSNLVLPPIDVRARDELEAVRATVEAQSALLDLGREPDTALLEKNVENARRLGYPPLEARALQVLAAARTEIGGEDAVQIYEEALWAALSGGDRIREAQLYSSLVYIIGYVQGRHEDALMWKRFAKSVLEALGPSHRETAFHVYINLSAFAWAAGLEEAHDLALETLEIGEQLWGPEDHRLVPALNNLAITMRDHPDRTDEVLRHLTRALELGEKVYGRWNPIRMGPTMINLAGLYVYAGRHQEGLSLVTRCLEIFEEFYGEHPRLVYPLVVKGQILVYRYDQPAAAEDHLVRALPLARNGFGERHPQVADILIALGETMLLQLRYSEAEAFLEQAESILRRAPSSDDQPHHLLAATVGRLLVARTFYVQALERLKRSLDLLSEMANPDYQAFRSVLLVAGEAFVGLGKPKEAIPYLEQALLLGRSDALPHLHAEVRFALAQALWPTDRPRAMELAREALQGLADASSPLRLKRKGQVESWLTKRSPQEGA